MGHYVNQKQALPVWLRELFDPRPDKIFAQEHAEHRRLCRIFKALPSERYPAAARTGIDEQPQVFAVVAHGKQNLLTLGLLHFVNACAL